MIIYIADRMLNVVATASSSLPKGITIIGDEKTEDVDTGSKTFNCTLKYDNDQKEVVQSAAAPGNFLLRSDGIDNEFYSIVDSEFDAEINELYLYGEDAGLDLINTVVPEYTATSAMTIEQYLALWLPDGWEIGLNELWSKSLKLEWTGESTLTERLQSLACEFGGELSYSYEIERLYINKRFINIHVHRGLNSVEHNLIMGRDLSNIRTRRSVANLATAFKCTGGTPKGKKNPITFSGCDYSSDGITTHEPAVEDDDYQISGASVYCRSAREKWSSALDQDGLLSRLYSYDTTDKRTLFSHAVAELKKVVDEEINYKLSILNFPEGIRLGDRINVVDDKNKTYLEGRILKLTKSVTMCETSATIGNYLIKDSGIADNLIELAKKVRDGVDGADGVTISIESSEGTIFRNKPISTTLTATVYHGSAVIINQQQLEARFGSDAIIEWLIGDSVIHTGFAMSVSTESASVTYRCRLRTEDDDD